MTDDKSQTNQNTSFPLTRKFVISFSIAAALFFLLLSWAITVFYRQQSFFALFADGKPLFEQIALGLLLGAELGLYVALVVGKVRAFSRLRGFLAGIMRRVSAKSYDLILVALVAGLSEEVFFRATLQPMLGIWLTSVLFVLAHLGIGSFNWAKVTFGAFVFSMSLLFGFTYEQFGLVAAIAAHASYDLVFLFVVKRFLPTDDAQQVIERESETATL